MKRRIILWSCELILILAIIISAYNMVTQKSAFNGFLLSLSGITYVLLLDIYMDDIDLEEQLEEKQ